MPHRSGNTAEHKPGTTAQRIRLGLTGLAVAFLFVLLFNAITRSAGEKQVSVAEQNAVENEPSEPLADLGVAPGSKSTDDTNAATANQ